MVIGMGVSDGIIMLCRRGNTLSEIALRVFFRYHKAPGSGLVQRAISPASSALVALHPDIASKPSPWVLV